MSLRRFALWYTLYAGAAALLVLWVAITVAWQSGSWTVLLEFNRLDEGPLELVAVTLTVTLLPLAWYELDQLLQE